VLVVTMIGDPVEVLVALMELMGPTHGELAREVFSSDLHMVCAEELLLVELHVVHEQLLRRDRAALPQLSKQGPS